VVEGEDAKYQRDLTLCWGGIEVRQLGMRGYGGPGVKEEGSGTRE
jgi:hypothetical protein